MWQDGVSNQGPLALESDALPTGYGAWLVCYVLAGSVTVVVRNLLSSENARILFCL